jgi:hypothetical protein
MGSARRQNAGVSILILLDEGCRQDDRCWLDDLELEFQSLFSWMKVADRPVSRPARQRESVSILILLDEGCRHARGGSGTRGP